MRSVSVSGSRSRLRGRRWDVVVLGSALPGLIAAARMAMGRLRVLLVEEEDAARLPVALREPFFLPGATGGALDACLRALSVPLIDRRRLEPDAIAYQVVLPGARVDVASPEWSAEEWVTWGLAKPDEARALAGWLAESGELEARALLEAPIVRSGAAARLGLARGGRRRAGEAVAGGPEPPVPPALLPVLDAQVRALASTASPAVAPAARIRLLAGALGGGASFPSAADSLIGLMRRRLQSFHGELRLLRGPFELVAVGDQPGVAPAGSGEVWLGRALVLNAPVGPLASWLAESGSESDFLPQAGVLRRRAQVALKAPRECVPEGMARRVIRLRDPAAAADGSNVVSIAVHPDKTRREVEVVASCVLPETVESDAGVEDELEGAVRELLAFAGSRLRRAAPFPRPHWDDDQALEDPEPGRGWPEEVDLRLLGRPPVYRVPREALGVLGLEGDCLLGWRAGEAILAELS
jgi:hypothetical protein